MKKPITDVAVLYVDPRGPYPKKVVHWYDEKKNALTYDGDLPVVAHPPCGLWGNVKHLCKRPSSEKALAMDAVGVVRRLGGVLEHPANSTLWKNANLKLPPKFIAPTGGRRAWMKTTGRPEKDAWGGYTLEVEQVNWGHPARKRTWLYIVGCSPIDLPKIPPSREPTHWISGGRKERPGKPGGTVPDGIKVCSAQQRRRTPDAFADWLIEVARRCRKQAP